jgi:hypothetical protein
MNLNELTLDAHDDAAMVWAKQHEFLIRKVRYEFYAGGGLAGAMERATKQLVALGDHLRRALVGDPDL